MVSMAEEIPINVTIGMKENNQIIAKLKLTSVDYVINSNYLQLNTHYNYRYSICVPVIYGSYYTYKHIVEFVEWNRLFGAEQIYFYVNWNNVPIEMRNAYRYYQDVKRFVCGSYWRYVL